MPVEPLRAKALGFLLLRGGLLGALLGSLLGALLRASSFSSFLLLGHSTISDKGFSVRRLRRFEVETASDSHHEQNISRPRTISAGLGLNALTNRAISQ